MVVLPMFLAILWAICNLVMWLAVECPFVGFRDLINNQEEVETLQALISGRSVMVVTAASAMYIPSMTSMLKALTIVHSPSVVDPQKEVCYFSAFPPAAGAGCSMLLHAHRPCYRHCRTHGLRDSNVRVRFRLCPLGLRSDWRDGSVHIQ